MSGETVAVGADHAGFELKAILAAELGRMGHGVLDLGTSGPDSVDYPDYAAAVVAAMRVGRARRGVLVCGSGVGMSIAANKVRGVRAALGVHSEEVRLTRAHNNANVLTLGARFTDPATAGELLRVFLETPFEDSDNDGGRHARRVSKISQLEDEL